MNYSKVHLSFPVTYDRETFENDLDSSGKGRNIRFHKTPVQHANVKTACWLPYLPGSTDSSSWVFSSNPQRYSCLVDVENNVVHSRVTDELREFSRATGLLDRTNDESPELLSTNIGKDTRKDMNRYRIHRDRQVRWNDVRGRIIA